MQMNITRITFVNLIYAIVNNTCENILHFEKKEEEERFFLSFALQEPEHYRAVHYHSN
jgi:hypothetical protein